MLLSNSCVLFVAVSIAVRVAVRGRRGKWGDVQGKRIPKFHLRRVEEVKPVDDVITTTITTTITIIISAGSLSV